MNSLFKIIIAVLFISTISCADKKQDYFYHVLMIEYAQDANIDEMTNEVLLFKNIPAVIDVEFGMIKPTEKNKIQNFTHCLILKFKNEEGLQKYLKDPYHEKIYKKHKPLIVAIYTADFNTISLIE